MYRCDMLGQSTACKNVVTIQVQATAIMQGASRAQRRTRKYTRQRNTRADMRKKINTPLALLFLP